MEACPGVSQHQWIMFVHVGARGRLNQVDFVLNVFYSRLTVNGYVILYDPGGAIVGRRIGNALNLKTRTGAPRDLRHIQRRVASETVAFRGGTSLAFRKYCVCKRVDLTVILGEFVTTVHLVYDRDFTYPSQHSGRSVFELDQK